MKFLVSALLSLLVSFSTFANDIPDDPLASVQWDDMYGAFLKGSPAVFDNRVKVIGPDFAEDPMNVPITVDASELSGVKRIVIFADFNPIPLIARYYPINAKPSLSFRFKIQQASPVRAAVLTDDNVWHVGGMWVNSAGGGCTVASTGRLLGDWADFLGDVYGKRWQQDDSTRLRLKIHHPMDTGLVDGIPEFFIQHLSFTNTDGDVLGLVELYEPINENPVLSFDFNKDKSATDIYMTGVDNNGNEFEAEFVQ